MSPTQEAAMKMALEALELPCSRWNGTQSKIVNNAITALRAALAEPVQKPVAWRLWDEDPQGGGDWRYYDAKDFKTGIDPMAYFDGFVPLYTFPPQRSATV